MTSSTPLADRITVLGTDPFRAIYGTLMVMTALAVFEDPAPEASPWELVAVIFVPLFALMAAHGFAEAAREQIALGRRLTWPERRHLMGENARFLLVGVGPVLLLSAAAMLGANVEDATALLLLLGTVTLFAWGWVVGRRINLGRLRTVLYASGFAALGLLVLALETALH